MLINDAFLYSTLAKVSRRHCRHRRHRRRRQASRTDKDVMKSCVGSHEDMGLFNPLYYEVKRDLLGFLCILLAAILVALQPSFRPRRPPPPAARAANENNVRLLCPLWLRSGGGGGGGFGLNAAAHLRRGCGCGGSGDLAAAT